MTPTPSVAELAKMQEEFQDWAHAQKMDMRQGGHDWEYLSMPTRLAWKAWQAAWNQRAATVQAV